MAVRVLCLAFLLACGGSYGGKPRGPGDGRPHRGIEAAALPYSVLDARTGRQVDTATFWQAVVGARVVCVGEEHPNPHHHWFQLHVMQKVAASVTKGTPLALGMEMFQRPYQGVLDDYAAKRIDTAALLSRSGYEERWGYDYGFYGPTIDAARAAGASLLALNAPRELTKKIVRHGLESLTAAEKGQLPELVLDDAQHRAWFDTTMEEVGGAHGHGNQAKPMPDDDVHRKASGGTHGTGGKAPDDDVHRKAGATSGDGAGEGHGEGQMPSADRIYTAQVLWDESMADGAARWATTQASGLLVLLAGNGHCHDSAIVNRVKRRGVDRVISIQPVLDTEGRVASALARPVNDYLVVLELPKGK